MALIEIEYGSVASSSVLNENFESLSEDIQTVASNLSTINANLATSIATVNTSLTSSIEELQSNSIGAPVLSLDGVLNSGEIWLEGAEVSCTTYADLYDIYGTTYGTASTSGYFVLPDFRNRAIWGGSSFGYLSAGLPQISGSFGTTDVSTYWDISPTGGFSRGSQINSHLIGDGGTRAYWYQMYFYASNYDSIYGNSSTVQPPAIKVRVKTRYV